jgi:putative inorganic carbon (HCO3(-)) transporter
MSNLRKVLASRSVLPHQVIEFLLIALAAPFLLFPAQVPIATLAAFALLVLAWLWSITRRRPWPVTPFNGVLLPFAVMVAVGIIVSGHPDVTLSKATGLVLGLGLFRWAAAMQGQKALALALAAYFVAALGVWGAGLLGTGWLLKIPALQVWLDWLPRRLISLPGAPSAGISPNQLAGVLAFLLPLPVALALEQPFTRASLPFRVGLGALALAWGGTLLLTQSRSGWIGGVFGLVALAALWGLTGRESWQRWVGTAVLLLVVVGGIALVLALGLGQGGSLTALTLGTVESPVGRLTIHGRLEIWSRALYAIQDFPFTGCGLGTFRRMVWVLYPIYDQPPGFDLAHAHNVFLQTALDFGLPGLVAYLGLLGVACAAGWQMARRPGRSRWLGLGLLAGLFGLHVYSMTDALAPGSRPHFLLWWALGLLAAGQGQATPAETEG